MTTAVKLYLFKNVWLVDKFPITSCSAFIKMNDSSMHYWFKLLENPNFVKKLDIIAFNLLLVFVYGLKYIINIFEKYLADSVLLVLLTLLAQLYCLYAAVDLVQLAYRFPLFYQKLTYRYDLKKSRYII